MRISGWSAGSAVKGGKSILAGRRSTVLRVKAAEGSHGDTPVMERKRPRRRGMFVLPSLFTAGNIAAGYYAITQSPAGVAPGAEAFRLCRTRDPVCHFHLTRSTGALRA